MGVGIYLYAPFPVLEQYDETVNVEEQQNGDLFTTTISTPLGRLTSVQKYSSQTYSLVYIEHFIKKPEDLAIMRYLAGHTNFTKNFESFSRIDRIWGPGGMPAMLPPRCTSPLQLLLTRWAGIETTIALYMDAPDEWEQTLGTLETCDDPCTICWQRRRELW